MKYQIKIEKDAQKFLKKLPRPDETRVLKAIAKLPDEGDRKQMKGHPGFFRLRVGDYRIIYTVDNGQLIVRVVDAGNRGQIYNRYLAGLNSCEAMRHSRAPALPRRGHPLRSLQDPVRRSGAWK